MQITKGANGSCCIEGIDVAEVSPAVYEALRKLKDYEKTGLNPGDFRSDSYEVRYMYKVFYTTKNGKTHYLLCDSEDEAREMKLNLEVLGYKNVYRNIFIWQVLIEDSE